MDIFYSGIFMGILMETMRNIQGIFMEDRILMGMLMGILIDMLIWEY
jgi:hypothetical protein